MLGVLLGGLKGMPPVGGMMSDAQVADVVNLCPHAFRQRLPGRRFGRGRCGREAAGDGALIPGERGLLADESARNGLDDK